MNPAAWTIKSPACEYREELHIGRRTAAISTAHKDTNNVQGFIPIIQCTYYHCNLYYKDI